ncbi:MAG TPA: hypothetical protein VL327_05410, partial [Pyrinomonadaceae bacterium]|nr:hypothetical protein [Pyrinomonadaceae bacterium]
VHGGSIPHHLFPLLLLKLPNASISSNQLQLAKSNKASNPALSRLAYDCLKQKVPTKRLRN